MEVSFDVSTCTMSLIPSVVPNLSGVTLQLTGELLHEV